MDEALATLRWGALLRRRWMAALVDVTLTQWRTLYAAHRLERELRDAFSQQEVAREVEMDEGTISVALRALRDQGLIDIAPDCDGFASRVMVTDKGRALLARTSTELLRVAATMPVMPSRGASWCGSSARSRKGERTAKPANRGRNVVGE